MKSSSVQLSRDDLEEELHRLLGCFFVTFAGVELNLSLRVGGVGTFGEKLERLISSADVQWSDNDDDYCKILAWYMAADSMRQIRNRLAHGRWGYLPRLQLVVHVSGYPPDAQDERRFSLCELDAFVKDAELLNKELGKITW
jgi:hypothetical protein